MQITNADERRWFYISVAALHFLTSATLLALGWVFMKMATPSLVLQPNGQYAAVWPWTWYAGLTVVLIASLPLLLPALLVLPEGWMCMLLLLLPLNSGVVGYVGGRWYIRRRIRKGDPDWRIQHWQCPACGYDLTGSRHAKMCPECGEPIPQELRNLFGKLRRESKLLDDHE